MNINSPFSIRLNAKARWVVGVAIALVVFVCLSCAANDAPDPNLVFDPPPDSEIYVDEPVTISVTIKNCVFDLCNATLILSVDGAGAQAENYESVTDELHVRVLPSSEGDVKVTLERSSRDNPFETSITLHAVERPPDATVATESESNAAAAEPICGNSVLEADELCEPGADACPVNEACNAACMCEPTGTIEVLGGGDVFIRTGPDPDCLEAQVGSGAALVLDARNADEPAWYHVKDAGWVYGGALEQTGWTFTADPTTLPVDEEALGCE